MLIVTTDFVPGQDITEVLGIARGSTIRAKHVGKDIMAGLRSLANDREEPEFRQMPLAELCTYGFELLIRRGLELGLGDTFLASPTYKAYAEERAAAGL